jgi:hypothetical protein
MTTIKVPVINEAPNTITVTFPSEYAVSFEAANPDGVAVNCQPGGPGILGGPEYVNFLQKNLGVSSVPQTGYRYETFQLAAYPNHTFYSFKDSTTGTKKLVAFNTMTATTAAIPTGATGGTGAIGGATFAASGATAVAKTFSTSMTDAGFATFTWSGTSIGSIRSGQGTTAMVFDPIGVAGTTGTVIMTVVNEMGNTIDTTQTFYINA